MTATVETAIWLALRSRIATLPFSPALPVAYPASTYRPDGKPYLAVGRVSIAPQRVFIGRGAHDRRG